MKVVTAEQMRDIDRQAIRERGIPGLQLMENAGRAVADAAYEMTESCPDRAIVVVCGRGNNGGDGFVAARHLAKLGRTVEVFLAAKREEVSGDAKANLERLAEVGLAARSTGSGSPLRVNGGHPDRSGGAAAEVSDATAVAHACAQAGLVVDALLGTGLSGQVSGLAAELIAAMNGCGRRVLAVDIPSGLAANSGAPLGAAVRATHTVTMGLPKLGMFMFPGADYVGKLTVADIGFPGDLVCDAPGVADLIEPEWVRLLMPSRRRTAHKGDFGRVLVIAGSVGMTGAACLCAEAALRVGAGLVTVGCPESLNDILEVKLTEAMSFPLPETYERTLDTRALAVILELAETADVLAIGPGISRHPDTALLVQRLVGRVDKPMVVDADALNALSAAPALLEGSHAPAVLTPHPGEMARLTGVSAEEVQGSRAHFAKTAASRFHSVMILKGAYSLICETGRPLTINPTGNPGMASGGTGDVLTGMVAGLVAQGLLPFEAACAGAYLHGLAGDLAADSTGQASLVAGDLIRFLPQAICQVLGPGD